MKYTLILLIILLFIWLSYFVIKKLGFFDWFRATWFYQTTFYKCISFVLDVYTTPFKTKERKKNYSDEKKISASCNWLGAAYIFSFLYVVIGAYVVSDGYSMIQQIKANNYGTISGKVLGLTKAVRPSGSFIVIEIEDGSSKVVQYMTDEITPDIKGRHILINYVVSILGFKQMVVATSGNKIIGSVEAVLNWRSSRYAINLKWLKISLFLALVLPWIRYWKFGLMPLRYQTK